MLFGALHGVAEASRLRRRKCRPASRLRRRKCRPASRLRRHLREARHNCNRLQANIVSTAGGKTAPCHSARRAPQSRMAAKGI